MTTDSNLDAYFAEIDAEIYQSSDAANAEAERRRQQYEQNKAAAILAIDDYLATLDEPVADLMRRSRQLIKEAGNSHSARIIAVIETQGIEKIVIESSGYANPNTASIQEVRTGHQSWSNCTPENLRAAIVAARAEWLQQHQERRQAEQRRQEHRAALSAALAAWEPAYRAYLDALNTVYTYNTSIFRSITSIEHQPFEARHLTYGIVYGEGADPATESTWIKGDSTRGGIEEIGHDGIVFDTRYYFPVSVTALQTWTPARCKEISGWSTSHRPPIRTTTINSGPLTVKIAAPPSRAALDQEIETAIFAAGGLLDWPHPPTPPTAPTPELEELILRRAAELAAEHLSEACNAEVGEQAIRTAISDLVSFNRFDF